MKNRINLAGMLAAVAVIAIAAALAFAAYTRTRLHTGQWKPDPQVDRLQKEFWAKHPAFTAPFVGKSLTVEQWEKAQEQCADADEYAGRFLELAKAHPKTPTAEQALEWIIGYCPEATSGREAIEILSRDFSDHFANQFRGLIQPGVPYADHYFRAIIEKSPSRQMRGLATLAQARFRQAVMQDNAAAEMLFEQVVEQYADIAVGGGSSAKLGELAQEDLFNLRNPGLAKLPLIAGQKAPPFEAVTMDGKTVKFPESYTGKVVLIDFWATWCGPCVAEVPNVVDVYKKYHGKGLEVLSVSLDQENAAEIVARFVKKHDMAWPQIYDGKYLDATIATRYGITSIPHALVVDADTGVILAEGDDARGQKLAASIAAALAAKKTSPK